MGKREDRIRLVGQINHAALLYKRNLVGKRFMYVFNNRFIEVLYRKGNFRHLTGVDTELSAEQFYRDAVRGRLTAEQISFNSRHPYDLSKRKVQHLEQLSLHTVKECFVLEGISTSTAIFEFGTTDKRFTVCLNRRSSECFNAESLRDEDCSSRSSAVHAVTHIFSMPNDTKLYDNICFIQQGSENTPLSREVLEKLNDDLIKRLAKAQTEP